MVGKMVVELIDSHRMAPCLDPVEQIASTLLRHRRSDRFLNERHQPLPRRVESAGAVSARGHFWPGRRIVVRRGAIGVERAPSAVLRTP